MAIDEKERLRRWRLVLGKNAGEGMGQGGANGEGAGFTLSGRDRGMDGVLEALYNSER